jgi:hypothetical protein
MSTTLCGASAATEASPDRLPIRRAALAAALLLAAAPVPARGDGTAGCHCFRDRTFEPDRPGAADPYILATARSSLLSAAFGVPKGDLVRAVMSGTAPEDLWIAHWAAGRAGRSAAALLEDRARTGSWAKALAGVGGLAAPFAAALARDAGATELAALAVDDVLVGRLKASPGSLRALRAAGASTEETVVATLLSAQIAAPVLPLVAEVKSGRATWGSVLRDAGLAPGQLDGLVRALVR